MTILVFIRFPLRWVLFLSNRLTFWLFSTEAIIYRIYSEPGVSEMRTGKYVWTNPSVLAREGHKYSWNLSIVLKVVLSNWICRLVSQFAEWRRAEWIERADLSLFKNFLFITCIQVLCWFFSTNHDSDILKTCAIKPQEKTVISDNMNISGRLIRNATLNFVWIINWPVLRGSAPKYVIIFIILKCQLKLITHRLFRLHIKFHTRIWCTHMCLSLCEYFQYFYDLLSK